MDNRTVPAITDFDVSQIDWRWAIEVAALRLRIRPMPLLEGYLLEAYLSEHPSLTPAVRMTGHALIELHRLIDPNKGLLGRDLEDLAELQKARKAYHAIAVATRPQLQAREAEMSQHYAQELEALLLKLLEVKGVNYVLAMGHAHSRD